MARMKETDKRTISKTVQLNRYDFETSLASLADTIAEWRKEYGDNASIDISYSHGYYNEVELEIELYYSRLETDDEVAVRVAKAKKARATAAKNRAAAKVKKAEQEKDELARLIKEHPDLAKSLVK